MFRRMRTTATILQENPTMGKKQVRCYVILGILEVDQLILNVSILKG